MNDIKFACPHCHQHITCDADYGDAAIDCPACGNGMVVPRLTATESKHPDMLIVASTPTPKHHLPATIPDLRAWTEQEWEAHARSFEGSANGTAPNWVLSVFGTLIMVFVLRINHAGVWPVIVSLLLGAALSGFLIAKDRKSRGAYNLLKGLGFALALCALLPVVALGILFIGCVGCR